MTTSQLRQITVDPQGFVAQARMPAGSGGFFSNVQRNWIEAACRAYYAAERSSTALWAAFNQKTSNLTSQRRRSMRDNAERMLEQFIEWDLGEADSPVDLFPPVRDVLWQGHVLAIKRDLVYLAEDGYLLRQLWTDQTLRLNHPDAGLMAAAALVCADFDLGEGRSIAINVWQLRDRNRRNWTRAQLQGEITRLQERLDAVAEMLATGTEES